MTLSPLKALEESMRTSAECTDSPVAHGVLVRYADKLSAVRETVEQEMAIRQELVVKCIQGWAERGAAAEAEVERLRSIVVEMAVVRRARPDAIGLFACVRCGGQGPTPERVVHDDQCEVGGAITPSTPERTGLTVRGAE